MRRAADGRLQPPLRPEFRAARAPNPRRPHRPPRIADDHEPRSGSATDRICAPLGRAVPRHDDPRFRHGAVAPRGGPVEVFAAASVLIDPAIGEAGDVDTAVVTLRTQSGALCQISNSRRAIYGYDQRIEALGSKGALRAENVVESTISFAGDDGIISDKPLHFFLERYAEAYRRELDHFIGAIASGAAPLVSGSDGVKALALADAGLESFRTGRAVRI